MKFNEVSQRHTAVPFTLRTSCSASGQYKDGVKHGLGKYTFADGEVAHDGEWENDEPKK